MTAGLLSESTADVGKSTICILLKKMPQIVDKDKVKEFVWVILF
jgi:hypothetical protein